MPQLGIRYHVAVDGISLWLLLLTALITPIATWASFGSPEHAAQGLVLRAAPPRGGDDGHPRVDGSLPLLRLLGADAHPDVRDDRGLGRLNRIKAALKFFLYTFFGSILMLGAILYVAYTYAKLTGGQLSFDYFELQRVLYPQHLQVWLFGAFALAFLIKVPMFPFHTWLPDAHTEAPTAGSIILAAVMLKMGTYGYLRFCMGLFPEASIQFGANLAGVAVLGGILYGALCALATGRREAPRRVLLGRAPRLRDAGPLRGDLVLDRGGRPADDQPRHLDRGALPPGRRHLRPSPHAPARRVRRPREGDARLLRRSSSS